jgi:hypothetical protein
MAFLKDVDTSDWFEGQGIIVYDPDRGDMKTRTKWWVVVNLDRGITDYYRHWANKQINPLRYDTLDRQRASWKLNCDRREDLLVPAWGAHMSIIRGEKPYPDKMHLWKKYDGQKVDFKYSYNVRYSGDTMDRGEKNGVYWFVDAVCDVGKQMREEFNLKSDWTFHITVGRT